MRKNDNDDSKDQQIKFLSIKSQENNKTQESSQRNGSFFVFYFNL